MSSRVFGKERTDHLDEDEECGYTREKEKEQVPQRTRTS